MLTAQDYQQEAPRYHPEFGYLVPNRSFRRTVGLVAIVAACGIGLGALATSALILRQAPTAQAGFADAGDATVGMAERLSTPEDESLSIASAPAAPARAASPPTARSCAGQTWPYIDGACLASQGTSRKVRVVPAVATTPEPAPEPVLDGGPEQVATLDPAPEPAIVVTPKTEKAVQSRPRKKVKERRAPDPRYATQNNGGYDYYAQRYDDVPRDTYYQRNDYYPQRYDYNAGRSSTVSRYDDRTRYQQPNTGWRWSW